MSRRPQLLAAAINAAARHGTAHPVTHQAIADAHADGATVDKLARALNVPPAVIVRVVLATRSTRAMPS
ncbi:hypothetical protein OG948_21185 [Embleya sp. NBC_00888]|uniref:hypothetical protein n=1 Tax=Embleya sp. NBC_00888 TaxID=2975960 RepID=UPI003869BDBD|nr:hypothetical protein OG948_21185 [Embleya sp. NBC_00888]